jgi:hypothetical protein
MRARHDVLREGTSLGLIVATAIWVWLAAVDAVTGRPFHTFNVLGGVVVFTTMHFLLNVVYGVIIVSGVRAAKSAPSVFIAVIFGLVMMQIAFAMLTAILSNVGIGPLAWILILGGSLIGTGIAVLVLNRRYPFAAHLREAEEER